MPEPQVGNLKAASGLHSGRMDRRFSAAKKQALDVANNAEVGDYAFPLETTNDLNGTTSFTDSYAGAATADNPSTGEDGWWASTGGDGHLIITDTIQGRYIEFWKILANRGAASPASTQVGQVAAKNLENNGNTGGEDAFGYKGDAVFGDVGGTTGSKIAGFAGTFLPGEMDCPTCINHVLAVIVPSDMNGCNGSPGPTACSGKSFVNPFNGATEACNFGPQTETDSTTGDGSSVPFCEGAKIFLPSTFTLPAGAPVAIQAIVYALQTYGGIIVDQGGSSGMDVLRFYTAGYFDVNNPPNPVQPGDEGVNLGQTAVIKNGVNYPALGPDLTLIGENLWIMYTDSSRRGR